MQDLNDYGAILTRHWTYSQVLCCVFSPTFFYFIFALVLLLLLSLLNLESLSLIRSPTCRLHE